RLPRRSADTWRRRDEGREAAVARRGADADEDSGATDRVRGCAATAARADGTGCARGVARRAADHVSPRAGTDEGPSQIAVRLEARAGVRRHREDARRRAAG